jgi:hypothetical protein
MDGHDVLAERFGAHRARLRAVAYHTLGSASEADDAVGHQHLTSLPAGIATRCWLRV